MKLQSNAKINLTLDITGKTENGYHLIDSVFQSISLFDEIEIEKSDTLSVSFSDKTVAAEKSIAKKTAEAFFEYAGISGGADIYIRNNIPSCSGMGGGSGDAAAVLIGLCHMYQANLTIEDLIKITAPIGADIPFCLVGGTARVTGIGEKIKPLPFAGEHPVLIIKKGEKQSTAKMYEMLDSVPVQPIKTEQMLSALKSGDKALFFGSISNAFTAVSDISNAETELKSLGAEAVGLSGSGPTVFGIFADKRARDEAFLKFAEKCTCFKAEFSPFGVQILR
ncbi:MAG TPA: 4-(cytidine 5'-diphospho)-2-C-methyl-D-erythritol kinase [Ruminococcaceae bacterium]|nr:4-(cytidine 5'-diphospho)-2-C-methyl-D-erythritol kinase [Oscillospiraceae bacterium]